MRVLLCSLLAPLPLLLIGAGLAQGVSADEGAAQEELRESLDRALPLLQASMETWIRKTACISCHHQGLGTMAVSMARERDVPVDEELHARQIERMLETAPGGALHGDAGINGTFGRSFQLLALAAAGTPRDARTDALAHYIQGNVVRAETGLVWLSVSFRPPMEASRATATAFALRALDLYGPDARRAETSGSIAGARRWLAAFEPESGEERVMRLLGLGWAGAERDAVNAAVEDVLAHQRDDGGWAQLATADSDAYATGQALVALQQIGGVSPTSPAFRRGLRYLLDRQHEDGSWLVATRRRAPGLPYFETGFPYRRHQFISAAATAWAAMAICCALDPSPSIAFRGGRPPRRDEPGDLGLDAVHLAAAFGTREELERLLDSGADPNAVGADELRPLHLAVHDPAKVALLLERGAQVDARTKHGATPLILAAWYGHDSDAAELLLERGAEVDARSSENGVTPLLQAVGSRKHGLIGRLLAAGADLAVVDTEASSALHWAVTGGDVETAGLLLAAGAAVDARCDGATALHWASHDGNDRLVRLLLENGADANARDDIGMTALAWAAKVEHGHARVLDALLAVEPDASLSAKGRTPLDWAREYTNELAIDRLEGAASSQD